MKAFAIALLAFVASSSQPPSYTAYRVGSPITIDGKLDEPAWFAAPSVGEFQFPWWKSGKKEGTVVKLLWDDENLYIANVSQDEFIAARHREHDGKIPEDDCLEIMLAPNPATPHIYFN